jgi:hypothetical protein
VVKFLGVRGMCKMPFMRFFDAEAEVDRLDILVFLCVGEMES